MRPLTETVKKFVLKQGADFVGIASAEVMNAQVQEGQRPEESLPGAKAVISFGRRMLHSIFKSPNIRISRMSYVYLHASLDDIAWKVASFLEEKGFDAVPIASAVPADMVQKGGVLGDISQRYAAVASGLGKVGLSHNFLHRTYGARVRLGSVITTAPLHPDRPLRAEVCPGEKCRKCITSCPAGAIQKDYFDVKACLSVLHKYNLYGLLKHAGKILDAPDPKEKKELFFDKTISEVYMSLRSGDPPFCIKCIEVCPAVK